MARLFEYKELFVGILYEKRPNLVLFRSKVVVKGLKVSV